MLGIEQFWPTLSETPGCDNEWLDFRNILDDDDTSSWRSARAKGTGKGKAARPKNVTFVLSTEENCQLAKIAWGDLGDDSGVAEMTLEIKTKCQWQSVSRWKASRSSDEQEHEILAEKIAPASQWKMSFLSTHGESEQMIVNYVKFFKVVLPVESEPRDVDGDPCHRSWAVNTKMWEDRKFTDVSVICDGVTLHAHRCILAAASPVFLTMFETSMKESQSHEILIEDVKSTDAVEAMVKFMYVASLNYDTSGTDCATLLVLGHKYAIDGLVTFAAKRLLEVLTASDACDILRMLRPYKEDPLLKPVFLLVMEAIHSDFELFYSLVEEI